MDIVTVDAFKDSLPHAHKKNLTTSVINEISEILDNPEMYDAYRDNLLGYTKVLHEGKYSITQYVNAIKFCTHRMSGLNQPTSFRTAFPEKYAEYLKKYSAKDISVYINAYANTKLVTSIMAQAMIPVWLGNMDLFQEALNTEAEIMRDPDVSPKVRADAGNYILTALKRPDEAKLKLDVTVKDDSLMSQLRETTAQLVKQQREMLQAGTVTAQQVAHSTIIDVQGEDTTVGD